MTLPFSLLAVLLVAQGASSGLSACIPSASPCTWSEQPQCSPSLLVSTLSDKLHRDSLELVVARSTEDITWSDPYDSIRTIYSPPQLYKGGHTPSYIRNATRVVEIRNLGLEQYACAPQRYERSHLTLVPSPMLMLHG